MSIRRYIFFFFFVSLCSAFVFTRRVEAECVRRTFQVCESECTLWADGDWHCREFCYMDHVWVCDDDPPPESGPCYNCNVSCESATQLYSGVDQSKVDGKGVFFKQLSSYDNGVDWYMPDGDLGNDILFSANLNDVTRGVAGISNKLFTFPYPPLQSFYGENDQEQYEWSSLHSYDWQDYAEQFRSYGHIEIPEDGYYGFLTKANRSTYGNTPCNYCKGGSRFCWEDNKDENYTWKQWDEMNDDWIWLVCAVSPNWAEGKVRCPWDCGGAVKMWLATNGGGEQSNPYTSAANYGGTLESNFASYTSSSKWKEIANFDANAVNPADIDDGNQWGLTRYYKAGSYPVQMSGWWSKSGKPNTINEWQIYMPKVFWQRTSPNPFGPTEYVPGSYGADLTSCTPSGSTCDCTSWTDVNVQGRDDGYCDGYTKFNSYDENCVVEANRATVSLDNIDWASEMIIKNIANDGIYNCSDYPDYGTNFINFADSHEVLMGEAYGQRKICGKFKDTSNCTAECGVNVHYVGCNVFGTSGATIMPGETGQVCATVDKAYPDGSVNVTFTANTPGVFTTDSKTVLGNVGSDVCADFTARSDATSQTVDFDVEVNVSTFGGLASAECEATTGPSITISRPQAWWQAKAADIISGESIVSSVPSGQFFNVDYDSNPLITSVFPGLPIFGGNLTPSSKDLISSTGWNANDDITSSQYDYDYFLSRVSSEVSEDEDFDILGSETGITPGELLNYGVQDDEYRWIRSTPDGGKLTLGNQNPFALGVNKVVLFVDGDVDIARTIILDNGSGFFMIIASGEISIDSSVDDIIGLFVAETFSTGDTNDQLEVVGTVIAGGINLERDLENNNADTPAEIFEFSPPLFMLIPDEFTSRVMRWREVEPTSS